MERYKVDNLKKGKETFEKYYGKVNDTAEVSTSTSTSSSKSTSTSKKKKVTMEDRRLEEGKRLFEKYGGPKTFNREQLYQHMQKKIAENQLAQEYASQKSTPQKSTLTPRAATTSRVSANGTRPYSDQEFTQMVLDYAKRTPKRGNQSFRSSTGLTYSGKQGTITFAQAQADPKYKEYVQKGSRNLKGYSDGFIGDLKAAAKVRDTSAVPDLRSEYMDNDEKEMYNYLLGKYGTDTADEFEKGLEDTLSARLRHDETKTVRDASRRNVLAGVGYNVYGAMESPKGYVYAATKTGIDKTKEIKDLMNAGSTDEYKSILEEYKKRNTPVDLNDPAFSGNAIMNASNEGIKQAIGGTPVRDFAIDTGLSMAQSVSRMPLGALNVVMAGGSAATDAYVDAANRGATGDQALLQGAAQGTAEGVGENFSLGKLKGMKEVPGKGAKAVIKNLAKQAIAEGSEEGATEIMNTITDKMIMGNKSNYDTAVNYYISQGMSKEQAQMRAYEEIAQNVGMAALGGATSGAIMGAGAQALGTFLQRGTMAQEYAEQRAITPEEQTAQQQAKEQRAPVASEGVSSMVQNTQNNAGAGSTAISDIPVSDENMPAASKIVPNAKENVSNINKNVTGINENVDDINENVTNINENVDNTSENVQNSISNIPEQMNTQTETNRQAETSQQEETSLQAETSRPAENQQSEKTAERAHPDSVQESYAREYAGNMPEETRRKEYIESHREDLNDIFSDLGENGRTAAVESYDPEVPVSQYRRAFNRYYDSGRYAADIGVAEKSALSLYLTGDQQLAAYKAGAQDRKLELDRMSSQRQQGPAHQGGLENLSQNATQAQQNLAESLGKRTGLKFILEDSLESGAVGEYEGKKGTIRISTNSENFLRTNSHELTHFIKENAPEHFTSYRDTVISAYLSAEGQTLEQMTESYEKAYEKHGQKLSRDEIMEEIAADATGKFWNDEEFVQKIARKDKTVAQKIVDFLSDMLDAIKSLIKNEHTGKAAETLAEQKDSFEKARNLWMDALDQASENYKTGDANAESAVRFQLAKPDQVTDKHIEENYDYVRKMDSVASIRGDEFKGDPKEMRSKIIELYNSYGNVVHNDVVGDVALSMRSVRNDLAHGYGDKKAAAFATVKDVIENGKVLRYSKDWKGRGYDSVSIGAKINITDGENAGQYYEVCVIKVDRTNRMYLHEVDIEKADSVPFNYAQAEPAKKHSGYNYLPISSIFDRLRNVKNENVKYQLGDNELEETDNKELVAIHNLSEEKLLEDLNLGGFPAPSIAVTKTNVGHDGYGDISVVFRKDTLDPKINKDNHVFGADAYTPLFPQVEYQLNEKAVKSLADKLETSESFLEANLSDKGSSKAMVQALKNMYQVKEAFIKDQNIKLETKSKEMPPRMSVSRHETAAVKAFLKREDVTFDKVLNDSYYREQYLDAVSGTKLKSIAAKRKEKVNMWLDEWKADPEEYVKKKAEFEKDQLVARGKAEPEIEKESYEKSVVRTAGEHSREFDSYAEKMLSPLLGDKFIRRNTDNYRSDGSRKSFSETHRPYTLNNITETMKEAGIKNAEGGFMGLTGGLGELRAAISQEYTSIDAIRKDSGRIQDLSEVEIKQTFQKSEELISKITNALAKGENEFSARDNVLTNLVEAFRDRKTERGIRSKLRTYYDVSDATMSDVMELRRELAGIPVKYFEAKPMRGVTLDEIAAVILPTNASDNLKARLNQEGVNTILYDPNLPDARKKAISELKDVRFQIDDSDMDIDYDEVVRENGELRKINEELKNQLVLTKDYTPRKEDIRKYAKSLLREYNSTYSQEKLESNLSRFYEYIQKAERMDAQELANVATQIGRAILEKSQQTDQEQVKVYKNILQDIKGTPIYVPEEVRRNLDSEGGYNNFRKRYFGKLNFRNNGVSVDVAYNELAGMHPELFPLDIVNPTDQLLQIADVLDDYQPKVENPFKADMNELSVFLGQEILDNKANIRNIPPTLADKIFAKANRTEQEYIAKRKEYEQKLREYRGNVREREQGRQDKKQIIRDVTKMQKWLLSPTDRDHVPESMRTAVAKFLSCVDYSSSRLNADGNETQRTREWNEAKKVYDTILKNNGVLKGETSDIYVEVDPDLVTKLDELQSMAEGKKIEDFTPRELRTLRETVSAMKHSIEDANKMYTNKRYEKASEAAESTLREWQGRKNKKTIKALSAADKFLQVHMLDSFTAFDRLGKAATTVYQGLRDGFDTKMRDTRLAQEYMKKLKKKLEIGGKEIQEWTGNKAKRQTFQVSGGEISLTPAQVMSLYELNKRPQAREHLYNQLRGIRTQGVEREVTVKGKKLFKVVEANVPVAVTPSDVKAITDTLTPKQKALADGVVSFFTDQTAAWGNEVSMTLYGYKKFNAPNYFPIVVDKNEIAKTNADVSRDIQTLKNLGITKNTTKHAKNGLIIEDIFDVYTRQADQMGSYHSFVVPLSDFQKYYNFNDVEKGNLREQMERVYGKEMGAWVDAFLKDLNGVGSGERELTSNLLRNAKSAAVGWNLRTAIQQPTAYFRAAAEIDPKYLAQGLKPVVSKEEWTQVQKYSPIAWWKDQGFFDINTGRSMKSMLIGADTTREKMINKSMDLAGKGDELAWKRLWIATKAETAALHPELTVGSEEFLQKSGARFSEIIDKTQVVDSVFHRSWAMREQWTKFYTAFMSEPIKSYNMLYRAAMDVADSKEINGKAGKTEKTKFARVAAAYAVTGAITALAASIMDVVRDNDDDKGIIEKYLSALGGNIADNLNVLNLIPIAKDVVSMFGGNSAARMDMQGLQYLVYACNEMKKFVEGDSKYTTTGIMYKWISPLARMTGIPIANLLRDTGSVVDTALDIAGANAGDYWKTKRIYDISSADNVTMYAKKALKAYREGKKELGDRILSDLLEAGQSDKTVNSGVKRGLKNDPVIQEAAEAMMNWDLETYEEKVEEVADRGIDKELIVKAVDMVINKKKKDAGEEEESTEKDASEPEEKEEKKETPLYEASDANDALNAGEYDKANKILDKVVESKMAEGKKKKEAISSVKSSFSSKYKKRYIAAGADERAKIEIELERLRVGGSRIFSSEDFARWRKNAKKK